MTSNTSTSRRLFLGGAVLSGAALAIFGLPRLIGVSSETPAFNDSGIFADPKLLTQFGEAYRKQLPAATTLAQVESELFDSISMSQHSWSATDVSKLRALLREQINADYRAGSTLRLDGWLLSATEARLSLLVTS